MISKTITVTNPTGLHARPAAVFTKTAAGFRCSITVCKGTSQKVNAKSMIMLLSLSITQNTEITITADGEDELEAVAKLTELVSSFTE